MKKTVVLLWLLGTVGFLARAHERDLGHDLRLVTLPGSSFTVNYGESRSLSLGGWHYVKKIILEAQGTSSQGGMMEVVVNGDVKGSVYVPGGDPSYIVTIEESAEKIIFRHRDGGGARVFQVKALLSHPIGGELGGGHVIPLPSHGMASHLANRSAHLVDRLRNHVDPETEYVRYLLPIKTTAGRANAIAMVSGDLSEKTREALIVLAKQIEFAEPLIQSLMKKEVVFEMAVDLLSVKYTIYRKVN